MDKQRVVAILAFLGLCCPTSSLAQVGRGAVTIPLQVQRMIAAYVDYGATPSVEGNRSHSLGLRGSAAWDRYIVWTGMDVHRSLDAASHFGWEIGVLGKLLPGPILDPNDERLPVSLSLFGRIGSTRDSEVADSESRVSFGFGPLFTVAPIAIPIFGGTAFDILVAPRADDVFAEWRFGFSTGVTLYMDSAVSATGVQVLFDRRRPRGEVKDRWAVTLSLFHAFSR